MLPPASESLVPRLLHLLGRLVTFANGGVPGSIVAILVVWYHKRIWQSWTELKNSRDPRKVYIWNLIPRRRSKRGNSAVTLLKAINQGAVDAAQNRFDEDQLKTRSRPLGDRAARWVKESFPFALRPSKASLIWTPMFPRLRIAQQYFVPPPCRVEEFGESVESSGSDAVGAIRRWLERSAGPAATDEGAGRIWVFGAGSGGKTIFMNRLFLDLIGADGVSPAKRSPTPVPMLASAENLGPHVFEIDDLKRKTDVISAFATVWLKNRKIGIPEDVLREDVLRSLVEDFKEALAAGDIVLILDGVDELGRQERDRFAEYLLAEVRFWVASNRPGNEPITSDRSVTLHDVWSYAEIATRLDQRFPDPAPGEKASPMVKSREILKKVIKELIEDHNEAVADDATDQEHHWLCQPGNLGRLITTMEREQVTDERKIRRLAASQARLFREIFKHAVNGIGADADRREIQLRLFELAAGDPTDNSRRGTAGRTDDPIDKEVLKLKEIIHETRKGPAFRHMAFRDFFIAGRIANEILDRSYTEDNFDELARVEAWDSSKRDSVESWLKDEPPGKAAERLRSRLRQRGESHTSAINPTMRRNLLDLLLAVDRSAPLEQLDLTMIPGARLDLHLLALSNCRFDKAILIDAELTDATFSDCSFAGADLSRADAVGTRFRNCSFGDAGLEDAIVSGMAIAAASFTSNSGNDQRELLMAHGASDERSRYRGAFGKAFAGAQTAFLGPGLERLENGAYLRAIKDAVAYWTARQPGAPVYLVDLMAGGSYRRVTDLLKEFPNLHILGIDKDPSAQETSERFAWIPVEIGRVTTGARPELGVDLRASLSKAFGAAASAAHIIVAKKALHELKRANDPKSHLQTALIRLCAFSLRPGGRLILFEDSPGPENEGDLDRGRLARIHAELDSLRQSLPSSVSDLTPLKHALELLNYDGSETSQIGFVNSWIMLKDWANQNRHEVENRYFASVAEIRGWASGILADCGATFDNYRLNPLIFNELGIQQVLEHVEKAVAREEVRAKATGKDGTESGLTDEARLSALKAKVIKADQRQLRGMVTESERLKILIDFSRKHLADDSPLGKALGAAEEPIVLANIDPALAPLDTGEGAWSFNLRCAVLVFEKT